MLWLQWKCLSISINGNDLPFVDKLFPTWSTRFVLWSDFLLEDQFHDDRYLCDLRWPAVHESNLYVSITLYTDIVLNFCSILRNRGQNRRTYNDWILLCLHCMATMATSTEAVKNYWIHSWLKKHFAVEFISENTMWIQNFSWTFQNTCSWDIFPIKISLT